MMTLVYTILTLTLLGAVSAIILYATSRKFHVEEDPLIGEIEAVLPNNNCGACGQPGCHAFAEAVANAADLSQLHCPVGGNATMKQIASLKGVEAVEKDPYLAVVRCSGTLAVRPKTNIYDGAHSCTIENNLYAGDTGCADGCLGLGECADACEFDALYMDPVSGLPVVVEDKCTACGLCVKACPRDIMALWPKGRRNRRIYVACLNEEKGGTARKYCSAACSGCAKCQEACRYEAITVENYLATIDPEKCKLCQKCVDVCDAESIKAFNFPPKKEKAASAE